MLFFDQYAALAFRSFRLHGVDGLVVQVVTIVVVGLVLAALFILAVRRDVLRLEVLVSHQHPAFFVRTDRIVEKNSVALALPVVIGAFDAALADLLQRAARRPVVVFAPGPVLADDFERCALVTTARD